MTQTVTRNITSQPGHYIRIRSSLESGIAPLDANLTIEGSFSITSPQITTSGIATVEWLPWISPTEFGARFTTEGALTITVSAIGPDGKTYSDSVTVTVISKTKLENLLKAKWEGMRTALVAGDVATAVTNFTPLTMEIYREQFTSLSALLPTIAAGMGNIMLVKVEDNQAECEMRDTINGTEYSFYLLFLKGGDGIWKIRNF
jgi:hypothetical protein